jgi:hypothetical protein
VRAIVLLCCCTPVAGSSHDASQPMSGPKTPSPITIPAAMDAFTLFLAAPKQNHLQLPHVSLYPSYPRSRTRFEALYGKYITWTCRNPTVSARHPITIQASIPTVATDFRHSTPHSSGVIHQSASPVRVPHCRLSYSWCGQLL